MMDPHAALAIAATFLIAGTVKGVIGVGLPTISLGLLTALIDLPTAMALLLIPSLMTNILQASSGGNARELFRRLWSFLLSAAITIWVGAAALTQLDLSLLSTLLGIVLLTYAAISLAGIRLSVRAEHEVWAGPVFGAVNGVLTGMTGSFVVPGVMYLQAIGLPRDMLVQAMGMLFLVSTLGLAVALGGGGFLTADLGIQSAAALVPALAGMFLGRKIRHTLSEAQFRKAFFVAILILGGYIALRSL
ncbi:sulfite exporter TauE/SafE family protein [Hwanghaeella grinnelliae]|uniref:Probable membrane transporter protein n=2 Tax=Hwanghaeella grinnelliae TaxID=2500179 RepID=A0A3S2VMU1_9PROT|nr:sulfite exporter TauE/SafE family protein [Hwanghaeella grinnelliae]